MTGRIDLDRHLEAYLAIRDALGLTAGTRARLLCSFLDCARGEVRLLLSVAGPNVGISSCGLETCVPGKPGLG
jgi:hypothetical protein